MNRFRLFARRPRTTLLIVAGLLIVLATVFTLLNTMTFRPTKEVRVGNGTFSLWVADSERERVQGLSGVKGINQNGGLLMVFDTDDTHGIWMKDMNFPLDIVWLDSNKKVVHGVVNAQPEDPVKTIYEPKENARYVLELSAGSIQRAGIKMGDIAKF